MSEELVTVLRQIRDELREMNGKDAEGNMRTLEEQLSSRPVEPTRLETLVTELREKSAEGNWYSINWKVVDHQSEKPYPYPLQSEEG